MTHETMEKWVEYTEAYITKEEELFEFIRDCLDEGKPNKKSTAEIAARKAEINSLKSKANSILTQERLEIGKRVYSGFGNTFDPKESAINQVVFGVAAGNLTLDEAVNKKRKLDSIYRGPVLGKTM